MRIFGYEITFSRKEKRTSDFTGGNYLISNASFSAPYGTKATDQTILGLSPVWAAIRYISEGVAMLPFDVYRSTPDGNERNPNHPLQYLISERPHPHYSRIDFLSALVANACLGDGFARIHFDPNQRPYALELLPRAIVSMRYGSQGQLLYDIMGSPSPSDVYSPPVIVATLQDCEIIHIKGVTLSGVKGERLTLTHKDGFGAALSAQKYVGNFFDNGAAPSGALVYPSLLTKEQIDKAEKKVQNKYSGADNAGRVMILDGGMKFERFSMGPQEAALVDFRNLSVEDCSRIFKVPLHMLSSLDRSTFSNIEQQEGDYYTHCLPVWSQKIEQEFNYKLFTALERSKRRAFVAFDYTFARMGDSDSTAKMIAATVQNGVMTANEWRKRLNLQTIPDGNRTYIQQNMMPTDMVDEVLENKYEKDKGEAAQDQAPDVEETDTPDAGTDNQNITNGNDTEQPND